MTRLLPQSFSPLQTAVTLFLGNVPYGSFAELIGSLPDDAVASPRRSTVPLIAYWRRRDALEALWASLGVSAPAEVDLRFEHSTPVRKGTGKPSYTDLMIVTDAVAVAIEAKFTEPRYETVRDWLGPTPSRNRHAVLNGWLSYINDATGGQCTGDSVKDVPYQVVHRTAAVCAMEKPHRIVLYQVFKSPLPPFYANDLGTLIQQLPDGSSLSAWFQSCPADPLPEYQEVVTRWDRGSRDVSADVRRLLSEDHVFEFSEEPMRQVLRDR